MSSLRDSIAQARVAGGSVQVPPDELARLLDAQDAAHELAAAVAACQSVEVGATGRAGNTTASEIRNRLRRSVEERTLRMNAALAKFRAVTAGKR